jgi:hypothetical protein
LFLRFTLRSNLALLSNYWAKKCLIDVGTEGFADGSVSVRFKPVAGERDQAAGIVWRYRDPDNYYIVRANALEDNVVLYKVAGGKRISLEPKGTPSKSYGVKQKTPKQTWSTLSVHFRGSTFEVFFDGAKIKEVIDCVFQRSRSLIPI